MGGRPFSDEEQRRLCLRLCLDIGHSEPRPFSLTRALNSARSGNQNAARNAKCPSSIKRTWETRRDLWCLDRYTRVSLP
jgi:hypothetical protein